MCVWKAGMKESYTTLKNCHDESPLEKRVKEKNVAAQVYIANSPLKKCIRLFGHPLLHVTFIRAIFGFDHGAKAKCMRYRR